MVDTRFRNERFTLSISSFVFVNCRPACEPVLSAAQINWFRFAYFAYPSYLPTYHPPPTTRIGAPWDRRRWLLPFSIRRGTCLFICVVDCSSAVTKAKTHCRETTYSNDPPNDLSQHVVYTRTYGYVENEPAIRSVRWCRRKGVETIRRLRMTVVLW